MKEASEGKQGRRGKFALGCLALALILAAAGWGRAAVLRTEAEPCDRLVRLLSRGRAR